MLKPEHRMVIEEVVGRRDEFPPGALAWHTLKKVLRELIAEDDELLARRRDNLHYESDLIG